MKFIYIVKGIEYLDSERIHKHFVNYTFCENKDDASRRLIQELNKMRDLWCYVNWNYTYKNWQIIEYIIEKLYKNQYVLYK